MAEAFVAKTTTFIRDTPATDGQKKQQLLWGDFVNRQEEEQGEWVKVRARGEEGWLPKSHLQDERLLEICFVDIGQGDGCLLVTPEDRKILIDGGMADYLFRFLSWRFNLRNHPDRIIAFETAVITHSDQDHYGGFQQIFESPQLTFANVYHNGLVERSGDHLLGRREQITGRSYLTELCPTQAEVATIVRDPNLAGRKHYPKLLRTALDGGRVGNIAMLSSHDGFLPGYEADKKLSMRVLGPVPETLPDSRLALRWFGDEGKTKNGHSVVLLLTYDRVRILFGGDLNTPSAEYLLEHYTGLTPRPTTPAARQALVAEARKTFEVDAVKACHHGSSDFSAVFLEALNALVTVVSSGDDESHCHPRPDTLGAIGRFGRGERPLIFSTELARSTRENIRNPVELRQKIRLLIVRLATATTPAAREQAQKALDEELAKIERSVAVYGMITLRTDGRRMLFAQKLEKRRPNTGEEFDIHLLGPGANDSLELVPKEVWSRE